MRTPNCPAIWRKCSVPPGPSPVFPSQSASKARSGARAEAFSIIQRLARCQMLSVGALQQPVVALHHMKSIRGGSLQQGMISLHPSRSRPRNRGSLKFIPRQGQQNHRRNAQLLAALLKQQVAPACRRGQGNRSARLHPGDRRDGVADSDARAALGRCRKASVLTPGLIDHVAGEQ